MGCGASLSNGSAGPQGGYKHNDLAPHKRLTTVPMTKNIVQNGHNTREFKKRVSSIRYAEQKLDSKWQHVDIQTMLAELKLKEPEKSWWNIVDDLVTEDKPLVIPDYQRKQWKTVRLFISSTFRDMNSEREYLVKNVVPALRQWCDERKLRLIECDLRWGVPKDADTRETLMACLSEIDRCREENVYPYFLCMLSERYGYVCDAMNVPDDIKSKYNWLPGMSVTALEIFTGAYWDKSPHALFMLRDGSFISEIKDERIREYFTERKQDSIDSLNTLKDKIKATFPSNQIKEYKCHIKDEQAGKISLTGFDKFGAEIIDHFKRVLTHHYPNDALGEEMTEVEILREEQKDFLLQRSGVLLGRDEAVKTIENYIEDNSKKSKLLLLAGFPGAGKSSLMAYAAKMALQKPDYKVFYHFVGATPDSTNPYSILSRIYRECMPSEDNIPKDVEEMIRFAPTMFQTSTETTLSAGYKKLVVFIDALNQMEEEANSAELSWLPKEMSRGLRVIVSTLDGKCLQALKKSPIKPQMLQVEPLKSEVRRQIVVEILQEFNKQLDEEQLSVLVAKEDSGRPLWLSIACEELRVYGDFRTLIDKIVSLPKDLAGLTTSVLDRIGKDYGEDFVRATLCVLETSRFGLMETEILELLALKPIDYNTSVKTNNNTGGRISMAQWAYVYLGLKSFLRPCGTSGEGRLDFYHRSASKVVRKVYLNDPQAKLWWHQRLADYFQRSKDVSRKAEELPFHLQELNNTAGLEKCLLDPEIFLQLYQEKTKLQLMKYWSFIGPYDKAAQSYFNFLSSYTKKVSECPELYHLKSKIGWFLIDIGEYDKAIDILDQLLLQLEKRYGEYGKELADPLHAMTTLFYRRSMKFVYGSNPQTKTNRQRGAVYSKKCCEVFKKHYHPYDNKLGEVLSISGYFNKQYLEGAEKIFLKNNNRGGLAVVYFMLGGKNQYNKDMNVPINFFEKSLSLCSSSFGRLSLHTARCCQLYGQMYWNHWCNTYTQEFLEKSLGPYQEENDILIEMLGPDHPTSIRSREDCIIVLTSLKRHAEADALRKLQPANNESLWNGDKVD